MKILGPGETGFGYLVEYDSGYISPELTCADGVCSNASIIKEFKSNTNLSLDGDLPDVIEVFAVLQKWGVENKNGRLYPKEILEREAKRYQEFIDMGTSLGELNHPESSIIDGERVSHMITEIWWEGKTLMGKLELDTTPGYHKYGVISSVGDKVLNMIRKGWTVGISSRGVGSLKQEGGKNVVQDDFELICWDIVTSPSTPGSWISASDSDLKQFTENELDKWRKSTVEMNQDPIGWARKANLSEKENKIMNGLKNFLG
ncbi:MAG: hypothetical protein GTN59_11700 [Candidatus Dadabacteria bacterium]|nr:hypothetical protein [Candidatus Dadabacteria bacterium]